MNEGTCEVKSEQQNLSCTLSAGHGGDHHKDAQNGWWVVNAVRVERPPSRTGKIIEIFGEMDALLARLKKEVLSTIRP